MKVAPFTIRPIRIYNSNKLQCAVLRIMDDFVRNKIEEWGLLQWTNAFDDNCIDEESFLLLDSESLKELIPPLGPRLKTAKRIKSLQIDGQEVITVDPGKSLPGTSSYTVSPTTPTSTRTTKDSPCQLYNTPKRQRTYFDIRQILEKDLEGKDVISEMETGLLSYKLRLKAVRMLVSHLIEEFEMKPASYVKEALAKSIVEQFPLLKGEDGEGYEAWFTPSVNQHAATGYLEERLRNVRKRMKGHRQKPTLASSTETSSDVLCSSSLSSSVEMEEEIEPAEVEAMTHWLKHNKEPLSQVKDYQQKTAKSRLSWIRENPDKPVKEVFILYPRLLDTPGMINLDFSVIHHGAVDKLYLIWTPSLSEKVVSYADKQNNWKRHLNVTPDCNNDVEICNISLQCLPCILPPGSTKIKGKVLKASISDAVSSFVDVQKIGTNIPNYLDSVKQKQPFILILGERVKPEQVFVIIEREAIPQDSIIHAVDFCFKCFYVFDLFYPWQSLNSWEFLQFAVYGLGDGRKKNISSSIFSLKAF